MRKSLLAIIIAAAIINSTWLFTGAEALAEPFADIKGHWAEGSISSLYTAGIIKGVQNGDKLYILPEKNITRAEFVATLSRIKAFEAIPSKTKKFKDVPRDAWYKSSVDSMTSNGVVNGYDNGTFGPDRMITRAEIAAIIARAMSWEATNQSQQNSFSDVEENQWYFKSIMISKNKGLISGYPNGEFGPENYATRAEAFSICSKLINIINEDNRQNAGSEISASDKTVNKQTENKQTENKQTENKQVESKQKIINEDVAPVNNPAGLVGYNITASKGKQAYYQVYAFGMKDLGSFDFDISYDPSKVIAARIIKGSLTGENDIASDIGGAAEGSVKVESAGNGVAFKESGIAFTIIFNVLPDATGTTEVKISGAAKDKSGTTIKPFSIQNGSINIK